MHEATEARAERLLNEALARIGWTKEHLQARLKGDPHKVQIARELRARTTMPMAWIARELNMGSRGYLAWLLQRSPTAPPSNAQHLPAI